MGEVKEIVIPYKPRAWAKQLHESVKRWIVLVLHRRAGKTTAALNHLQRDALRIPESEFAYIAPTYKQAKRIAWKMIKKYSRNIPGVEYNESELIVKYPNGSTLSLYGSENVDALRGIGLWGCALDENSQQPSNIFSEVISKCLADHLGYCIWLGTPKGKNEFFKTYEVAKNSDDHLSIFKTIDDSIRDETGETIENLRIALEDDKKLVALKQMTEDEFQQEWFCSFEAAIQGAYYSREMSQARRENRVTGVPYDNRYKVNTAWDLGVGDNMAIWFWQQTGLDVRLINYIQGSAKGLVEYIGELYKLREEHGYIYGIHLAPHDIESPEISTGKTLLEVAAGLKVNFEIVPRLPVEHGIDAVRRMFNKCWFDANKCAVGIDALAQYHKEWDDKRGEFKQIPFKDWSCHGSDAFRYLALGRREGQLSDQIPTDWSKDPEIEEFRKIKEYQERSGKGIDVFNPFN